MNFDKTTTYLCIEENMVTYISKSFSSLIGYSNCDIINMAVSDVFEKLLMCTYKGKYIETTVFSSSEYIFTKELEPRDVQIKINIIEPDKKWKILISEIPNSRFEFTQNFLESICNDNLVGIGVYSHKDDTLLRANTLYLSILKKRQNKSDIIGKSISEIVLEWNENANIRKIWNDVKTTGKTFSCDEYMSINCTTGKEEYHELTFSTVKENGISKYIVCTVKDISEKVYFKNSMIESELKYKDLFNNMSSGHAYYEVITDESGTPIDYVFLEINPAYEKIKGIRAEDYIGKRVTEVIPNIRDCSTNWILFFGEIALQGKTKKLDVFSEITNRWYSVSYYSTKKGYVCSIYTDITEQKECEEELKMRNLELHKENSYKSEYITMMSHELRTPLNVMLGAISLLALYIEKDIFQNLPKIEKRIYTLRQNCFRLIRLVNNIIDRTKIGSGYFNLNFTNCNIVDIIRRITLSVSDYIQSKNITLQFESTIDEKIIECDVDMFERIMLNLLSNAIKFTEAHGIVTTGVRCEEDKVFIFVRDNGIGIPKHKQHSIFELYKQNYNSMVNSIEGSGIGLSLVKALVELHQGKISVNSEVNKGSEFLIEIDAKNFIQDTNAPYSKLIYSNEQELRFIEKMNIELSDIYQKQT